MAAVPITLLMLAGSVGLTSTAQAVAPSPCAMPANWTSTLGADLQYLAAAAEIEDQANSRTICLLMAQGVAGLSWQPPTGVTSADVLVVGGGGQGGGNTKNANMGAGGGGGKVVLQTGVSVNSVTSNPVAAADGGGGINLGSTGGSGAASTFSTYTAAGGKGGVGSTSPAGGASGRGNAGGAGLSYSGGGGGGDSAAGASGTAYANSTSTGGNGGAGTVPSSGLFAYVAANYAANAAFAPFKEICRDGGTGNPVTLWAFGGGGGGGARNGAQGLGAANGGDGSTDGSRCFGGGGGAKSYSGTNNSSGPAGGSGSVWIAFVAPAAGPVWTTTSPIAAGSTGTAYSKTLIATGATSYALKSGSSLPSGLSLDTATGALTGTVTVADTYTFTVTATNSADSVDREFSLTISASTGLSTTKSTVGYGESATITPTGTTTRTCATFENGAINATPTWVGAQSALQTSWAWSDVLTVSDTTDTTLEIRCFAYDYSAANADPVYGDAYDSSVSLTFTNVVAPSITTTSPLTGSTTGATYNSTIVATGSPSASWSLQAGSSLPTGLSLASATGVLSGSVATAGTYTFTVVATNVAGTDSREFSLTVDHSTDLSVDASTLENGESAVVTPTGTTTRTCATFVDGTFNSDSAMSGLTTSWAWSDLMSLSDTADKTLVIRCYPFTYSGANVDPAFADAYDSTVSITFKAAVVAPSWTTAATLPDSTDGTVYSTTLVAAGQPAPTYSVTAGSLPNGLSLDSTTGVVSGTPTGPGAYSFTVTANNVGGTLDRTFALTVRPATPPAPYAAAGDTTATLSWAAITNAQSYAISDGAGHECTATAPTTTCTVSTLTNGTKYTFTLSVTINAVESAPSAGAPVTPIAAASLGTGVAQENGVPAAITVAPNAPTGGTSVVVTGAGWVLTLAGLDANSNPIPLPPGGTLLLDQTRNAGVSGTGFKANSLVYLYLHSSPTFLGTVPTDGVGSFSGTVPVPSGVALGDHVIQANGFAPSGATRSVSLPVVLAGEVSVAYTGSTLLATSGASAAATLSAKVIPATAGCVLTFTLDNGLGGAQPGPYTATTAASGIGTVSPSPTIVTGAYGVTVSVGGNCLAQPDASGSLVIGLPGYEAYGQGWYSLSGKNTFNFKVHAQSRYASTYYRGELSWGVERAWRFSGSLTSFVVNTVNGVTTGTSAGTGRLYWWNPALKGGCGYWQLAGSAVSVTIRYQASSGSSRSTVPGSFSARFGYTPTAGQPALPGSSMQKVSSGSIRLRTK